MGLEVFPSHSALYLLSSPNCFSAPPSRTLLPDRCVCVCFLIAKFLAHMVSCRRFVKSSVCVVLCCLLSACFSAPQRGNDGRPGDSEASGGVVSSLCQTKVRFNSSNFSPITKPITAATRRAHPKCFVCGVGCTCVSSLACARLLFVLWWRVSLAYNSQTRK